MLAARGFHGRVHEVHDALLAVSVFGCVCDVVGFDEDLVVRAVNVPQRVVMAHKVGHARDLRLRHAGAGQKAAHQHSAFLLLIFSVGVAVFLAAERAGNVVRDGGDLQKILRLRVQPLQFADRAGVGPDVQEVVNVVDIAIGCGNHFAENLSDGHGMPPLDVS